MQHNHLTVVRLLLLLLCKVSAVTVGSKKCFLTNGELKTAVSNYVTGGTKRKATIAKYGSPIGNWCVGKVKDFSKVFYNHYDFNERLTNWDTSRATTMRGMFRGASRFNQPLNHWQVGKVTDMSRMFQEASKFNRPLDSWNVSQVTNMSQMFRDAFKFNQPLKSWNVSRVTDVSMSWMFDDAFEFNQPLDSWDVSQVTDMAFMFYYAPSFNKSLDSWNVSQVTNMSGMFQFAVSFNQPLNSWDVSQVILMREMFFHASSFNQPLDSWNIFKVIDMSQKFQDASLFDQNLCSWGTKLLSHCDINNMFVHTNCPNKKNPKLGGIAPGPFCRACTNSSILIQNGLEKNGLMAQCGVILIFELEEAVAAGQCVTCALKVPHGDADLYIKFGRFPNVTIRDCDCGSTIDGPFDEDCTTEQQPAKANTTAYIAVVAKEFSSDMTLLCFINDENCLQANQLCNQTADCCGTMVCDGNETVANSCVPCKKPEPCGNAKCTSLNKNCASTSQCCRWYECDDVCQRNQ